MLDVVPYMVKGIGTEPTPAARKVRVAPTDSAAHEGEHFDER
jgi:hypothetical protein